MKMACWVDGNRVHMVCASMTSPASSQMTTSIPNRFNKGQNLAQAVVVTPMTCSAPQYHCQSRL